MAKKTPPEVWKKLLKAVESGLTNKDACVVAGIHEDTLYRKVKDDVEFSESLKKAIIKFKQTHISKITEAKTWQASAWMLERKFNAEFGKIDRVENKTVEDFSKSSIDDLEEELKKLEDRSND